MRQKSEREGDRKLVIPRELCHKALSGDLLRSRDRAWQLLERPSPVRHSALVGSLHTQGRPWQQRTVI